MTTLLRVRDLRTYFYTYDGVVKALEGVTFDIRKGETLGLVGETGCGKSVTALSILKLIPSPPGKIVDGEALFLMPDEIWEETLDMERIVGGALFQLLQPLVKAYQGEVEVQDWTGLCRLYGLQVTGGVPTLRRELVEYANRLGLVLVEEDEHGLVVDAATGDTTYVPERTGEPGPVHMSLRLQHLRELYSELRHRGDRLGAPPGFLRDVEKLMAIKAKYDLVSKDEYYMRKIRGAFISMIFQDPMQALNPVMPVGEQIAENVLLHQMGGAFPSPLAAALDRIPIIGPRLVRYLDRRRRQTALARAVEMLDLVKIPDPETIARAYSHELSGGMQQRVLIAMALSTRPTLLIADEPTTALDVTIQAQILELMKELKAKTGTSILLITHDLGVIAEMCSRVCVMYAGHIVERGEVHQIFKNPAHPYTQGLIAAIPKPGVKVEKLEIIKGSVPNLIRPPTGCRFHPRCPYAMPECVRAKPEAIEVEPDHFASCILHRRGIVGGRATG